jgi:hypothetical protein
LVIIEASVDRELEAEHHCLDAWKEWKVRWRRVAGAPTARDSEAALSTLPLESLDRKQVVLRDGVMVVLA